MESPKSGASRERQYLLAVPQGKVQREQYLLAVDLRHYIIIIIIIIII